MKVREVMTAAPKTVSPDTTLIEVVSLMCLYRFHGLPVVDGDELVGVIAEKDVLHRLFPTLEDLMVDGGMASVDLDDMMGQYKDVIQLRVSDLMTSNPMSVSPDMHILRAATVMVRRQFRRIPVTEGKKLVGMLSIGDIHKAIFHATISGNLCSKS